jgi:Transposase DDE domain
VIIEDSSTLVLPAALKDCWPGCGGGSSQDQERCEAALKLHVRLDLKSGQLQGPRLSAGRVHELHGPLGEQELEPGSLYIADRGYWSLERLRCLNEQKVRFCQHPKANTVFWDRQGKRIDLLRVLPRTIGQIKILHVCLGQRDPLPVRLIMVRVPEAVTELRRERLTQEARDKGRTVSPLQWELAQWTLIVTNAAAKHLGPVQALVLLRERWVIELLFKLWKSHGQIDQWRSAHPWRALCEVYAKLIAVVVQHWLLVFGCWHDPWRSLVKASAVVRSLALQCLEVLSGTRRLHRLVTQLRCMMQAGCRVNRRTSEPCLTQLLLEGLDWVLT